MLTPFKPFTVDTPCVPVKTIVRVNGVCYRVTKIGRALPPGLLDTYSGIRIHTYVCVEPVELPGSGIAPITTVPWIWHPGAWPVHYVVEWAFETVLCPKEKP